jgi:hypothetical protein
MAGGQIMGKISEPDDVDLFIGGVQPDAEASAVTARFIEEYKKRPDYHIEAEEAERILAGLGIKVQDYGMNDAQSLLVHWRRCVADLMKAEPGDGHVGGAVQQDQRDTGCPSPDLPSATQH